MSNRANIEEEVARADLVIGTVLIPGAKAPRLLLARAGRSDAARARRSSTSRSTRAAAPRRRGRRRTRDPIYVEEGVVHYCVTNMPGVVPHTSTYALTNATLSYALELADHGFAAALAAERGAPAGAATSLDGQVTHPGVAEAIGLPPSRRSRACSGAA